MDSPRIYRRDIDRKGQRKRKSNTEIGREPEIDRERERERQSEKARGR